jgi:competence protein ComEC
VKGRVAFLDVGEGDCSVAIDLDRRATMMVDCPEGQGALAAQYLAMEGIGSIDLVVISHSHLDHMGGLPELLSMVRAREVRHNLDTVLPADPTEKTKLRAALRYLAELHDRGIQTGPLYADQTGRVGSIEWRALSPTHGMLAMAQANADSNYSSTVLKLSFDGGCVVLLGADADGRVWHLLITAGVDMKADVFRLPHHGAELPAGTNRASLAEVLDAVDAKYHVISVGFSNRHGHPHQTTLQELNDRLSRSRLLCTQANATCLGSAPVQPVRDAARLLPLEAQFGAGGNPGGCRCAGTVTVHVNKGAFVVSPDVASHQLVKNLLGDPMS